MEENGIRRKGREEKSLQKSAESIISIIIVG